MTISAKVIADSISPEGIRLTTLQLRYPRFIHSEVMTHRAFSRNASSSRAIPVQRLIDDVSEDPAEPLYIGANKPGMQAGDELPYTERTMALQAWRRAQDAAIGQARALRDLKAHKQIVNRILEPFSHINVIVTATDWGNFFALRDHEDAEPHIRDLARAIKQAMDESEPTLLQPGEWHLPYVTEEDKVRIVQELREDGEEYRRACARPPESEWEWYGIAAAKKISAARCARVSYLTHDGRTPSIKEDLALFVRLVGSQPIHASPSEHQATPDEQITYAVSSTGSFEDEHVDYREVTGWKNPELHGNFRGWIQHRKLIPGECADSTFPD